MDSVVSIAEYLRTFLLPRPNIGTRTLDRGRRGKHRWTSRWTQGHEIETRDNRERGENKARGSKLREEGGKVIYHTPLHSALLDRDHSAGRWASNGAQTDTLPFSRQRAGEEANRHSDVRQAQGRVIQRSMTILISIERNQLLFPTARAHCRNVVALSPGLPNTLVIATRLVPATCHAEERVARRFGESATVRESAWKPIVPREIEEVVAEFGRV